MITRLFPRRSGRSFEFLNFLCEELVSSSLSILPPTLHRQVRQLMTTPKHRYIHGLCRPLKVCWRIPDTSVMLHCTFHCLRAKPD